MVLRKEAAAREIAKYMAHLYFSRGNKASTVEEKLVAVQSGDVIADEVFYRKMLEDMYCEGQCTEGGGLNGFGVQLRGFCCNRDCYLFRSGGKEVKQCG